MTRMLGLEIYMAGCSGDGQYEPIPVDAANWRASLFRTLCFDGAQRPALSRSLDAMVANGLLRVADGRVHIAFKPEDPLFGVCQGSVGGLLGVCDEKTNGITQVTFTEEKRKEEKRERARAIAKIEPPSADEPPHLPEPSEQSDEESADLDSGSRAQHEYALQLQKLGLECSRIFGREDRLAFRGIGEFADAQAAAMGITPLNVIHAVFDGFFADEAMHKHGWPPKFANDRKLKYFTAHPATADRLRLAQ